MPGDIQIEPPEGPGRKKPDSPHPWWSRVLYAAYAAAAFGGAGMAWGQGATDLAIGAAGIGLVLAWKAAQRVR